MTKPSSNMLTKSILILAMAAVAFGMDHGGSYGQGGPMCPYTDDDDCDEPDVCPPKTDCNDCKSCEGTPTFTPSPTSAPVNPPQAPPVPKTALGRQASCNANGFLLNTKGTCPPDTSFIETVAECEQAAKSVGLTSTTVFPWSKTVFQGVGADITGESTVPHGCFFKASNSGLFVNPGGNKIDDGTVRVSLCRCQGSCNPNGFLRNSKGTCPPDTRFIENIAECNQAAKSLGLTSTSVTDWEQTTGSTAGKLDSPHGCYFKAANPDGSELFVNPGGNKIDDDTDRVSLCRCAPSKSPTASPHHSPPGCKDSGFFCNAPEGDTSSCERWKSGSACYSGKCYTGCTQAPSKSPTASPTAETAAKVDEERLGGANLEGGGLCDDGHYEVNCTAAPTAAVAFGDRRGDDGADYGSGDLHDQAVPMWKLGAAGTNSCPPGYTKIGSYGDCIAAARAFGVMTWIHDDDDDDYDVRNETQPTHPKGCYVYVSEYELGDTRHYDFVRYNTHNTGSAGVSGNVDQRICGLCDRDCERLAAKVEEERLAAETEERLAAETAAKMWTVGAHGTNSCPPGFARIGSFGDCQAAASALGAYFPHLLNREDTESFYAGYDKDVFMNVTSFKDPKGCYVNDFGKIYYNTHNIGSAGFLAHPKKPICGLCDRDCVRIEDAIETRCNEAFATTASSVAEVTTADTAATTALPVAEATAADTAATTALPVAEATTADTAAKTTAARTRRGGAPAPAPAPAPHWLKSCKALATEECGLNKIYPSTSTPSLSPSVGPSMSPTPPHVGPSMSPSTSTPSLSPTLYPSVSPTTSVPTVSPSTSAPSKSPSTSAPSKSPSTSAPSKSPSTSAPSKSPSTSAPSKSPTLYPSVSPTTSYPTVSPTTSYPTVSPSTSAPSKSPTLYPSASPTTSAPSVSPTSSAPSVSPTTSVPSVSPTSSAPSASPSAGPTRSPTTSSPSASPTTSVPTSSPTHTLCITTAIEAIFEEMAKHKAAAPDGDRSTPAARAPGSTPAARAPGSTPAARAPVDKVAPGTLAVQAQVQYSISGMVGDLLNMADREKDKLKSDIKNVAESVEKGSTAEVKFTQDSSRRRAPRQTTGTAAPSPSTGCQDAPQCASWNASLCVVPAVNGSCPVLCEGCGSPSEPNVVVATFSTTVTVTFPAGTTFADAKKAVAAQPKATLMYTVGGEKQTFEIDYATVAKTIQDVTPTTPSSAATALPTAATVLIATVAALF